MKKTGKPLPGQGYGKKLTGGNYARMEGPYIQYSPQSSALNGKVGYVQLPGDNVLYIYFSFAGIIRSSCGYTVLSRR